jgi:hypothetical protein
VPWPGTEMEPRVPQNLSRVGETETLGMAWRAPDFATRFWRNQAFLACNGTELVSPAL